MPTYNYKCKQCGHEFEGFARMNDPCPPCPELTITPPAVEGKANQAVRCGGETIKTFNYVPPAHFHGGGWAADNYHKKR